MKTEERYIEAPDPAPCVHGSVAAPLETERRPIDPKARDQSWDGPGFIRRVSRGMSALSTNALLNIVSQVSLVPIFLWSWGKFRYGEWILLISLVQVLKLTDLGIQTYAQNRLCSSYVKANRGEFIHVLQSALKVQIVLGLGIISIIACVLIEVPLQRVLSLHTIGGKSLYAVGILLSSELLLSVPMGVIAALYRATGHLPRAAMIGTIQQILILACTIALLLLRRGFVAVAVGRLLVTVCVSIWIILDVQKLHPWLRIYPKSGAWRDGLQMIWPGLFFLLIPVTDYVANQVVLSVTQKTLAGAEVGRFATHRTIANFGQMVSAIFTAAVWPEITALYAQGHKQAVSRLYESLLKLNIWIVGAGTFGILPVVLWIYPWWTAHKLNLDLITLNLLLARTLIWASWNAGLNILGAINKHRLLAIILTIESVATSGLAICFIPFWGIRGAALAMFLGEALISAWIIPLLASRELEQPVWHVYRITSNAILTVVLPVIAVAFLLRESALHAARYWILIALGILGALLLALTQLTENERGMLRQLAAMSK